MPPKRAHGGDPDAPSVVSAAAPAAAAAPAHTRRTRPKTSSAAAANAAAAAAVATAAPDRGGSVNPWGALTLNVAAPADAGAQQQQNPSPPPLPPPPPPVAPVAAPPTAPPTAPPPAPAAAAAVAVAPGATASDPDGGVDLGEFGDLTAKAAALFVATTTATEHTGAVAKQQQPRAIVGGAGYPESIWDQLDTLCARLPPEKRPHYWGHLVVTQKSLRFGAELEALADLVAPLADPFVRPQLCAARVVLCMRALPIVRRAPLLPFLRMIEDRTVLMTPHGHTIASLLRARMPPNAPVADYPTVGLTGALCAAAFGRHILPQHGGVLAVRPWWCEGAARMYATYVGLRPDEDLAAVAAQATDGGCCDLTGNGADNGGGSSGGGNGSSTDAIAAAMPVVKRVCGALHRLAVAFAGASPRAAAEVPLETIARLSVEARDAAAATVASSRAQSSAIVAYVAHRPPTERLDEALLKQASAPLEDAWRRARVNAHLAAIEARAQQTDGVDPIGDAEAEVAAARDLGAEIERTMVILRGRALVALAHVRLSTVTDPLYQVMMCMRGGSLAIAAKVDACLAAQTEELESATRASQLQHTATKPATRLSGLLGQLATCHPLVLTDDLIASVRRGLEPDRDECERLWGLWRSLCGVIDSMTACVHACVFTHEDAALLNDAGAHLAAASAAGGASTAAGGAGAGGGGGDGGCITAAQAARFTALVAEYVKRCRVARAVAVDAARASPPSTTTATAAVAV